jgi:hypothetical protein
MNAAYTIWNEPLQNLCQARSSFYRTLVVSLLEDFCSLPRVEPARDSVKQATYHWLEYLLISPEWASPNRSFVFKDLRREVMESCLLNPLLWTHKLANLMLESGDEQFRKDWMGMYKASIASDREENIPKEQEDGDVGNVDDTMDVTEPESDTKHNGPANPVNAGGWRLWEGPWVPRPIGQ